VAGGAPGGARLFLDRAPPGSGSWWSAAAYLELGRYRALIRMSQDR
jgi:hypothetical protein